MQFFERLRRYKTNLIIGSIKAKNPIGLKGRGFKLEFQ